MSDKQGAADPNVIELRARRLDAIGEAGRAPNREGELREKGFPIVLPGDDGSENELGDNFGDNAPGDPSGSTEEHARPDGTGEDGVSGGEAVNRPVSPGPPYARVEDDADDGNDFGDDFGDNAGLPDDQRDLLVD